MQEEIEFYERQTCPIWVKIAFSVIMLILATILCVNNQDKALSLIFILIPIAGLLLFVWFVSLKTEMNSDGIYVKVFPMIKFKLYEWENISNIEIRKQKIIRDSRLSLKFGFRLNSFVNPTVTYNIAGRYCLQFVWKKSHNVRISTNFPIEMEEFLEKLEKINQKTAS